MAKYSLYDDNFCSVCHASKTKNYEQIAINRSAKTAHVLALKEASKPDDRFTFIELYTTLFRKIYDHEYIRNMHIEKERGIRQVSEDCVRYGVYMCYDHHEYYSDYTYVDPLKEAEKAYASCKWPNPLPKGWK